MTVRQPEADVGGAARGVHSELVAEPADQPEHLLTCGAHGADRHHQWVDDDVLDADAVIGGSLDDLLGDLEPDVGVFADAGLVVADGDHGRAVFGDEGKHPLHHLVLAGHRVDQGFALVDLDTGLEGLDDRGVDRERHVGDRLDQLDRLGQERRLVGQWDAGVDVEHVGAGGDLGQGIGLDPAEVAVLHLLCEQLSARWVDSFTDHDEGPLEADDDFLGRRGDHGVGHGVVLSGSLPPFATSERTRSGG